MFRKGDYIVLEQFRDVESGGGYIKDYIYKQRIDAIYLRTVSDSKGRESNGWNSVNYDMSSGKVDWRYATMDEIDWYEEMGGPCNISHLPKCIDTIKEELQKLEEQYG